MRSLGKSLSLSAVFCLMLGLPAFAGNVASPTLEPIPDLSFLRQEAAVLPLCSISNALPSNKCEDINGLFCKPAGSTHACTTIDGFASTCTCRASTCRWSCLL